MLIAALQKTSLLDFPGHVSALVFTQGCNFSCPYCHNPSLLQRTASLLPQAEVLAFLHKRKNLLQGVVITGGEPTLQPDLPSFCQQVKALGYAIKLDTNGSNPNMLQNLLAQNLVDYVALDIKADPQKYPAEIAPHPAQALMRSIELLTKSTVPHEFRVPCVQPFITPQSFQAILEATKPAPNTANVAPLFLQAVRLERVLCPDFFPEKGQALPETAIQALCDQAVKEGRLCVMR